MRQIIILVALFVFLGVSGQVANANSVTKSPNHWNTLAQCKDAYASGIYRVYVPTDLETYKRAVRSTEEPVEIEGYICIQMATAYGYKFIIQEDGTEFLRNKKSKKFTARLDCKNPVGEPTYLTQKKIEVEDEEESSEVTYDCPKGSTWDVDRKKCVAPGQTMFDCPPGGYTWDENRKKCIAMGVTETICPKGSDLDAKTGKCLTVAKTLECPKGKHWSAKKSKCVGGGIPWKWIGLAAAAVVTTAVVVEVLDDDDSCKTGCGTKTPQKDNSIRTGSGGNSTRPRIILGYAADGTPIYETQTFGSSSSVSAPAKPLAESKIKAICKDWVGNQCVAY